MFLTVFTPVYNRADTLGRLYDSLLKQSCLDFEWLIVDDGSTDETGEVVKGFTGEGKFPVRYIYKENGGKHTAHNLALEEARGTWFWCVDSDDTVTPQAVQWLLSAALPNENGILSYKTDLAGRRLGTEFPAGEDALSLVQLAQQGCKGEYAMAFRTAYARQFPFPVFPGERFVTENVVYDRMETPFVLLRQVTNPCEYQPEGYSAGTDRLMRNNPNGFCLYFMQRVDLAQGLKNRLVTAGKYWCFRLISGNKTLRYRGKHPACTALALPLGLVFRGYYKLFREI